MADVPASRHNGFHLVYADEHDVLATASNGTHIAQLTLGKGIHAITERSFGAGDDAPRRKRIDAAWSRLAPTAQPLDLDRLSQLLTEHDDTDLLAATCIHVPGLRYGTRSGSAIALARRSRERAACSGPRARRARPRSRRSTSLPWAFPTPVKPGRTDDVRTALASLASSASALAASRRARA